MATSANLLGNARVVRYLAQHHNDILTNFRRLLRLKLLRPELERDRTHGATSQAIDGDPDPISAGTAGEAALWGGSSAVVGMAANPFGAHQADPDGQPRDRLIYSNGARKKSVPAAEALAAPARSLKCSVR